MTKLDRRKFTKLLGAVGAAAAAPSALGSFAYAQGAGNAVVIGGGAGGASAAHLIKKGSPELSVTLIETNPQFTTCFFSNLYIGGFRTFDSITHGYDGLKKLGINVMTDTATDVDTSGKTVSLASGTKVPYDKLILSPGIDFKYDSIEGYSAEAAKAMPNAWKGGAQTKLLIKQLEDMEPGGTVVMAAPPNPFRCPPGPYERASMIAYLLKTTKPGSKLIIYDTKPKFSKQPLFQEGWQEHYPGIIEWVPPEMTDGGIKRVDPATMTVYTGGGEATKAAVANIIPAQKAGMIAEKAGCTDGDWCPINPDDFSSAKVKDVYVLGDASVAKAMPKSGFSANSQAKVVANAVQAELAGKKKFPARYRNTCWSLIAPDDDVKVGASYTPGKDALDATDKFVSKTGEDAKLRNQNFQESLAWYAAITKDMFAT